VPGEMGASASGLARDDARGVVDEEMEIVIRFVVRFDELMNEKK